MCYFTKFVPTLSKQSKAQQNMGAGYAFCPSNKLTFDLLTFKMVSETRVMWATSVPILVFLGLSILDLGLMYATDRQTSDVRHASSLDAYRLLCPALWGIVNVQ